MIVVVNSGPLISLSEIDQFRLLSQLFGRIVLATRLNCRIRITADAVNSPQPIEVMRVRFGR